MVRVCRRGDGNVVRVCGHRGASMVNVWMIVSI